MIAALFNIPRFPTQWQTWSFHNFDAHQTGARLASAQFGFQIDTFLLDPIPFNDFGTWLYTHQTAHNVLNAVLGLQGNDLTSIDPTDAVELTDWIELHAKEHVAWGNALGYG